MWIWWECTLIQSLWRTLWMFLKKLNIELPYDPVILLLGIYTEKTIIQKDTCIPVCIAALFTIARTWKQPRCPLTDEWIQKLWYIYIMECYSAIKRMKKNVICRNMDGSEDYHTKWNKSEKNKYHMIPHMWNLKKKKDTNELIYKPETDS